MIPIFEPVFNGREREYLNQCIDSGWISSQGQFVTRFEESFADYVGMPHGISASNCTTALHLALLALGIGPGDEVLCPDLTFIAPANMVNVVGATPVLVDVQPGSWGIDPALLEARITERTKAIIVVHIFGHAADMDPIMAIARRHGLKVIEDVAEAPGATYRGTQVGTFGDANCFSFFANKIITTGEGGMVLTRDADLATRTRIFRDHGMSREQKYIHVVVGFNFRMTSMQAAIGCAQLEKIAEIQASRNAQAAHYARRFAETSLLNWRPTLEWCQSVHWLATITLADAEWRDPLMAYLRECGIEPRPMVYPVHVATPFRDDNDPAAFPVSRSVSYSSLHLPSSTALAADDIDRICDTVIGWVEKNGR